MLTAESLNALSEINVAVMWHEFQETEKRLVRSFAGPPGLEDATRSEATRDRVVDTEYPNHGALRLTMPRDFRNAGLHTRWDDFISDIRGNEDTHVDQLLGIYMDDPRGIVEHRARSRFEVSAHGDEIPCLRITYLHESTARWTRVISSFGPTRVPMNTETASPPVVLSANVIHPEAELRPRPDNQMEVDAQPPAGAPAG